MEDAYKVINDTLVSLINEIWRLEEKAIITEEFKDISNNDMHVIEAIGLGEGGNMSSIARKLNVTVGTLTTAMNSLVNKKYVTRQRSEKDRRVVFVKLTERGERAYHHHADYHRQMTEANWMKKNCRYSSRHWMHCQNFLTDTAKSRRVNNLTV